MNKITQGERIWTKIVALLNAIEDIKDRFPEPRTKEQQELIRLIESRVVFETKKLKKLGD